MKEFFIEKDGFKIHAKLMLPEPAPEQMPLVLVVPGLTASIEQPHMVEAAEAVVEAGYAALRVELYGHGLSDGEFVNHNILEWISEMVYVIDYARSLPFVTKVFILAHSQGGFTAMFAGAAKQDQIEAMLLLAPATNIRDLAQDGTFGDADLDPKQLPDTFFWGKKEFSGNYLRLAQFLPTEAARAAFEKPVLLIHGTEDELVPYRYAVENAAGYKNCTFVTIEDDHHSFDIHRDQMRQAIKDFLADLQ